MTAGFKKCLVVYPPAVVFTSQLKDMQPLTDVGSIPDLDSLGHEIP